MTNARGRSLLQFSANARAPAALPSLPVLRDAEPKALAKFSQSLKEIMDTRHGRGMDPYEAWVTLRGLETLGLFGGHAASVPSDSQGVPIWTSRGRFELATLSALSEEITRIAAKAAETAAQQAPAATPSPETAGVTQAQLAPQLTALEGAIARSTQSAINAAIQGLSATVQQQISALEGRIAGVEATAVRARGYVFEQTSANAVWTVEHNLGRYPLVTLFDDTNFLVQADSVEVLDLNSVEITFPGAVTGWAVFR